MEFKTDSTNTHFNLAVQFVNNTSENIFLTGKAGTGKTTFLKYICKHCHKKLAIVAPTGVAAINAGGMTIHSLFQLPFGIFAPVKRIDRNLALQGVNDQYSLIENMRLNSKKREILQELELLIIDEVSMVRADLLDSVDTMLRHFRNKPHIPFGGVQMLFIGDMFQLPPVVNNNDWQILRQYYKSPFFFDSKSVEAAPPLYLELKQIYRQDNPVFINILNNIRNNKVLDSDLETLHERYKPGYQPEKNGEYITLSTHNAKADAINNYELNKLEARVHTYNCEIRGEFNEKALPAEPTLHLKEGAQIMFIKNDKGEIRRYYNGKIGVISRITNDEIFVNFNDGTEELKVEKETWTNIRYHYNQERDIIEEEELGSFTQYPIRLAWAITIHKSQGLTFEKAIIDAGESFAAGQVYVALSRMTSLDGLILYSRINKSAINTDDRVIEFTKKELAPTQLEEILKKERAQYLNQTVIQYFDWNKLETEISIHWEQFATRQIIMQNEAQELFADILKKVKAQHEVAQKFTNMLGTLLPMAAEDNFAFAKSRIKSATDYFHKVIDEEVFNPITKHLEEVRTKPKTIKYSNELRKLIKTISRKKTELDQANYIIDSLSKGVDNEALLAQITEQNKEKKQKQEVEASAPKEKTPKGESQRISLAMFKAGKSMEEISNERSMALSTIETHLGGFINTGEIAITELISEQKIELANEQLEKNPALTSAELKDILGDDFSWFEVRTCRAEYLKLNQ